MARTWVLLVGCLGCGFHGNATNDAAMLDGDARDAPGAGDGQATGDATGDWWNTAWQTRLPITIANTSSDPLATGFSIGLANDLGGAPCASTGDHRDVRITHGATELARVIDAVGPPQWTWFPLVAPIAAGATSTREYWLYCANLAAPAVADRGAEVFELYDAFETLDSARWTVSNPGAVSVDAGMLKCASGAPGDSGVVTKASVTADHHAVEYAAILEDPTVDWWGGYQNDTGDVRPWSIWYQHTDGSVSPSYIDGNQQAPIWFGVDRTQDTNAHIYTVEDFSDSATFRFDDTFDTTHAYAPLAAPSATFDLRLWNNTSTTNRAITFDWIRLRKAVAPAPTVTVGAAEMR